MSRGSGGDKPKTLEEMGVSEEEIKTLIIRTQNRDIDLAKGYITTALKKLNKTLDRNDKINGGEGVAELAARLVSLVDTVCGLLCYNEQRMKDVYSLLADTGIEGRDAFEATVHAKYVLSAYAKSEVNRVMSALKLNKKKKAGE